MRRGCQQKWLLALACAAAGTCIAAEMPLQRALGQLQGQGNRVVFSSELVPPDLLVDLNIVSVAEVRRVLPGLGLALVRWNNYWLVTRAAPDGHAPSAGVERPAALDTIETIIVTGTRHRLPQKAYAGTSTTLLAEELSVVPTLAGDAMRVTNRLPGISSVGVSARPRVRGGLQDELLVMVDGVELLDPYHLADFQSIFSTIDDRTVDAIDVYTGGFPARYGNRMSGVIEVSTLEQADKPGTEIGLSLFSLFANTRGDIGENTDYLVSARRGNLDILVDQIDSKTGSPKYHDGYGRIGHRFSESVSGFGGVIFTKDDITLKDDEERADSKIDSWYVWTRVDFEPTPTLSSSTVLTYTSSDREKNQFAPEEEDEPDQNVATFLDYVQDTRKYQLRSDVSYQFGAQLMEFGVQLEYAESDYEVAAFIDREDLGEILGVEEPLDFAFATDPSGWSGGAYWSAELVWGRFILQPGLRWDFQDYDPRGSTDHVSPRIGVKYSPVPSLTFRADYGRFHQPQGIHEMQVTDGIDAFFPPQRSDHFIAGVEWLGLPEWEVRAEVYQKRYRNTRLRFENVFNPFVILPELEPDRVGFQPTKARAFGADLEIRREFPRDISTVVRYSYMDAEDRLDNQWIPRRWSQRHTVNLIASWVGETMTVAAALTWHSGWRSSVPPVSIEEDTTLPVSAILNNSTLDDYVSFDLSFSKTWELGPRTDLTVFADITNVFDRDNQAGVDFDLEEDEEAGLVTFEPDAETLIPLIPSIGFVFAF